MTKRKKDRPKRTSTLLILLMLVGIGFILYPAVSNGWNSLHASRAIAAYSSDVENMDDEQCSRLLEDACRYNRKIPEKTDPYMMTEEDLEEYRALLEWTSRFCRLRSGIWIGLHFRSAVRVHTLC